VRAFRFLSIIVPVLLSVAVLAEPHARVPASAHAVTLAVRPGKPSALARAERLQRAIPRHGAERRAWVEAAPDTAKLLVILAEFVPESPDDPNTTGDGRFQLEPSTDYAINQPPHDHAYFDRQCRAVANYFDAASDGRMTTEWTLFPDAAAAPPFVVLPQRMRYYNPDTTDAALDRRLAEFFRDAVAAADARGAPFSSHDYVVVFHAGVGQDLLIDEDTPSDLVSAFLSFDELRENLGEPDTYEGIPVEGGSAHVREGLWLPETENQEGFEFAITGVFAQLLGSQLGLPILWNPDSGAPGIGRFGLMDQGGGNELGKVPAFPCAWSRFDLGWADLAIVPNGEDVEIRARGALGTGADLVLVPVDEREFFLLENRHRDVNADGEVDLVLDASVPIGVENNEYDFGIPGSGLLVWHIDQAVIDANREENRVNADFRHRGVKLLEADGLDEIGLYPEGGFGLPGDVFRSGQNDALGPSTNPSTASNYAGARTNIYIGAISDSGLVMRCDIESRGFVPGWPDSSSRGILPLSPLIGDVDGDGALELVVADTSGIGVFGAGNTPGRELHHAMREVSSHLVENFVPENGRDELVIADVSGRLRLVTVESDSLAILEELLGPSPIRLGEPRRHPMQPLMSASAAIGGPELELFAARNDSCYIWSWPSSGPRLRVSFLAPFFTTSTLYTSLVGQMAEVDVIMVDENGLVVGYSMEELLTYRDEGQLTPIPNLRTETLRRPARVPLVVDLDRDDVAEIVILALDGTLSVYELTDPVLGEYGLRALAGWPVALEANLSAPAAGDLDGDGYPEIVLGEARRVQAFARNGARVEGWPVTLEPFHEGAATAIVTQPLIADVDRDGHQDVIVSAPDGVLRAYARDGRPVAGWPLAAGRTHVVTPAISGFAGGSIAAASVDDDWLYALRLSDAHVGAHWPMPGGDRGRSSVLSPSLLEPPGRPSQFFREEQVYVYPNPAHERVNVRYVVGSDADVSVRIFDATGLEVVELHASGTAGVANEVDWDLRNTDGEIVSPGLYLVRLTVTNGVTSATHDTRVAIAR